MNKPSTAYERLQVSVPVPFFKLMEQTADRSGEKLSDLARDLLKRGLAEYLAEMSDVLDAIAEDAADGEDGKPGFHN